MKFPHEYMVKATSLGTRGGLFEYFEVKSNHNENAHELNLQPTLIITFEILNFQDYHQHVYIISHYLGYNLCSQVINSICFGKNFLFYILI